MSKDQDEVKMKSRILTPELDKLVEVLLPLIRDVVREEIALIKPIDDAWYSPAEIEALSCGKISAERARNFLRWGMVDGESDGREVRIYQRSVEELRKNKWRPLRQPDPSKLPPSQIPKYFPSQSVAS